jgi:hypothetical protein
MSINFRLSVLFYSDIHFNKELSNPLSGKCKIYVKLKNTTGAMIAPVVYSISFCGYRTALRYRFSQAEPIRIMAMDARAVMVCSSS